MCCQSLLLSKNYVQRCREFPTGIAPLTLLFFLLSLFCDNSALTGKSAFAVLLDGANSTSSNEIPSAAQVEFFETRIRPVLVEHCYSCHAQDAKNVRGGLLLDSAEGCRTGGESGPAVVPGQPELSLILQALRHESFEMPPDRKLPATVIRDFERWIQDGAVDPRKGGMVLKQQTIDLDEGRRFWCFRPIVRPELPNYGANWIRNDVDRFVAEVHDQNQVTPAADASPEQLIRRLYFALAGLPPTPDQSAAFIAAWNQNPESAVSVVVDELLESRHFGERWGRHWLDVARFAESSGGGRSLMYPNAWRYRDYVIRSFNQNKRFDQFIREQLAGDLLTAADAAQRDEQLTGVGYLILGAINYEEQDKESLRMDVVDEQIDSMGRTFLGMTLGCARCHDHKFDPIPTNDYYALAGIFRSTRSLTPGNVSGYVTAALQTGFDRTSLDAWEAEEQNLQKRLSELRRLTRTSAAAVTGTLTAESLPGIIVDDTQARFTGDWTSSSSLRPFVGTGYRHSGVPRSGQSACYEVSLPKSGMYLVRLSHNSTGSRSGSVQVIVEHAEGQTTVSVNQQREPTADGVFSDLGQYRFESQQPAVVTIDAESSAAGFVIADAVQFVAIDETASVSPLTETASRDRQHQLQELRKLEEQIRAHAKKKPEIPQVMCVQDEAAPADWHVHVRGGIRNLGPVVPRGILQAASAHDVSMAAIPDGSSGRLQLADWVASAQNPLTARVFVNRVWMHLIGEGLVRTPDNFGVTGQQPTHPELLDYLAASFVEDDQWSVKKLIRRICLSRTFRMSSSATETMLLTDPENRLLTRGFRRRLDAESLRDSMLMISGQLDLSVTGGMTIGKLSTYDNTYSHETYPSRSRSVFVPFFRNAMLDLFFVFDIANVNLVTGQRTASTLPSQALYLMNSPFVVQQSALAAEHFLATESLDVDSLDRSIDRIWNLVLNRHPNETERQHVLTHLADHNPADPQTWAGIIQALFGSVDFRYLD